MATPGNPDYTDRYDMNHKRRGLAVIINNVTFKRATQLGKRSGSDVDCALLKKDLESLGFDVEAHKDRTVEQMRGIFTSVSAKNHEDADCFLLVILSHGKEGVVYGTDGPMLLAEVCARFRDDRCPGLRGKPKIFILQACQGSLMDHGAMLDQQAAPLDKSHVEEDSEVYLDDQEEAHHSPPAETKIYIPKEPDVLVVLAAPPGYISYRNPFEGSWFIKTLCQELSQCDDDTEFMDLLTRVNYNVAYKFESHHKTKKPLRGKKQVPCVMSVLTKKLYLKKK